LHDYGYLIGRIFVNSENKFFIEGRENMSYNLIDFNEQELRPDSIQKIIADAMLYCIDFELQTPPFEQSSIITLEEKHFNHTASGMNTGKRIGFEFSSKEQKPE
jgi:hypothetical protein